MAKGGNAFRGGGGMGGGGGGNRGRSAPSIVSYRKHRGRNERFRGKQAERRVNKVVAEQQEEQSVVTQLLAGFGVFVVGCLAFLALVYWPRA